MALDPNATTKDFSLVIYTKTEVDTLMDTETTRVDTALASKSDSSIVGSPSGIATLNESGTVTESQLPIATLLESADDTNSTLLITPETLHYQITAKAVQSTEIGSANGVAPLNSESIIDEVYLPAYRNVQTFVVATLADMYAITTALRGDRCVVTSESTSTYNGEYVANIDYPVDDTGWDQLPNLSSVSSVNGATGSVDITSIDESATNATRLDAIEPIVTTNTDRITAVESVASTNTTAISTKADDSRVDDVEATLTTRIDSTDARVTVNEGKIATLEANTDMPYNYVTIGQTTVQTDVYTTINQLTTSTLPAGTYQTTLSMVFGIDSVVRSAYFRFSMDGGSTWTEVRKESQDVTDEMPSTLVLVDVFAGGVKDILIQARCEDATDVITIYNQSIVYERKV